MKKKRTWTALILIAALILIFAAPANCEAEDARILLMRCYQQDRSGVCSEAVLLDEEGCVWQYQSDDPLPDTDEERLAFLAECQNVTLVRRLDVNRVLELESLIAAAAEPQMEDQAFGIRDYGLDTYSAVRYGSDGIVEIIPLAITGNRVVENLEPNAYALYIACFTEVMGYDLEAEFDCPIKPLNIRRTPLAEFLGVDEGVFEGATLTASRLDCEAGYIDIEIDEEETGEKIEWLSGLVVTGKRNALCVTGNTEVYTLHSPEGAFLARFELYQGLLVMDDGMYAVETWAE